MIPTRHSGSTARTGRLWSTCVTGVLLLAVLVGCSAFAQVQQPPPHPIDTRLAECMGTAQNQSTYGMIGCIQAAAEEWDRELNAQYKKLMEILPAETRSKLKAAQKQWIAWRDKEMECSGALYYGMDGSMWKIAAASRHCDVVRQRALDLAAYRKDLEVDK
jgi:uncharacterized protein YecT (DUF1311 family)